jgi:hypothetical protein
MPNVPNSKRTKSISANHDRAVAACARACSAHAHVTQLAHRVTEDLDQITMPGVPIQIDEEDSIVTHVEAMLEQHRGT